MFQKIKDFLSGKKKKSIIISVSLIFLFAFLFIAIPNITNAAWYDCLGTQMLGMITTATADLIRYTYYIADMAISLFSTVSSPTFLKTMTNHDNITGNPDYYKIWSSVRDIANMGVVLGFVFIGIATTLRIQEYAAQRKLGKLIIVAILINFTPLMCGLIIDTSYIIMKGLQGDSIRGPIEKYENDILTPLRTKIRGRSMGECTQMGIEPFEYLKLCIIGAIFYVFSAFIYFLLAGVMLARWALLILLFIMSPFAFFCITFEFSKKYFDEWMGALLKWAFVGVGVMFCIKVAGDVFKAIPKGTTASAMLPAVFIVCMFLYVGLKLAMKSSGAAGAMAMAAGATVAGRAMGAVKSVGGSAAGVAGAMARQIPGAGAVSNAASKVSASGGRFLESVGLRKVGVTAAKQAKGTNAAQEQMKSMSDTEIKKAVERRGASSSVVAGGMKELASRGSAGTLNSAKFPNLAKKAAARGVQPDVLTKLSADSAIKNKKNPTVAELDQVGHNINSLKTPGEKAKALTQGSPHGLAAMSGKNVGLALSKASPADKKKMYDSVSGGGGGLKNQIAYGKVLKTKAAAARVAGNTAEADRYDGEHRNLMTNIKTIRTSRPAYYKSPTTPVSTASKVANVTKTAVTGAARTVGAAAKGVTVGAGAAYGAVTTPKVAQTIYGAGKRAVGATARAGSTVKTAVPAALRKAGHATKNATKRLPGQIKNVGGKTLRGTGKGFQKAGRKIAGTFKRGYNAASGRTSQQPADDAHSQSISRDADHISNISKNPPKSTFFNLPKK